MSPSEWKDVSLEDAIEFRNGKSSPERKDRGSNPVYGGNGVIGYTEEFNSSSETIIVGRVGAYCGSVYFYQGKCWVTDNAIIGKIKENYDGRFLFYLLKLLDLNSHRTGSSQPLVNQSILNSIQVRVPKQKQVQERIADLLNALDEKIELNRQTNQTLEAIVQAIYKEWFINFNFPGATGEMQDSELGPIPKGWRVGKLGDIVEFIKGVSYRSSELMPSKYALVTLKSIARGGGFNNDGFKEFNGRYKEIQILSEGDTVIAQTDITQNAEVVGCPAIVENPFNYEKLIASIDIVKCVSKNTSLSSEAIYYFLKDQQFKDYCLSHTNGSTVLHLRSSELPNYDLVIPHPDILKLFCRIIHSINLKMLENNNQIQTLTKTRDNLLPKLMSGEIKV